MVLSVIKYVTILIGDSKSWGASEIALPFQELQRFCWMDWFCLSVELQRLRVCNQRGFYQPTWPVERWGVWAMVRSTIASQSLKQWKLNIVTSREYQQLLYPRNPWNPPIKQSKNHFHGPSHFIAFLQQTLNWCIQLFIVCIVYCVLYSALCTV